MVDVGAKVATLREAHARAVVWLPPETLRALGVDGDGAVGAAEDAAAVEQILAQRDASALASKKGPIISTAVIAGVMAAKKTSDLIPFCHPLPLDRWVIGSSKRDAPSPQPPSLAAAIGRRADRVPPLRYATRRPPSQKKKRRRGHQLVLAVGAGGGLPRARAPQDGR